MIKIKKLSKKFGERKIFENLDITFKKNNISIIFGKSGEGKTTLFKMITGLLSPDSGEITGDNIGMVFQNNELFPHLDVLSNLTLPQKIVLRRSKIERYNRAEDVLNQLNIMYLRNKKIATLSGGEAQRVAIARELCMERDIILFDEPTSALDKENTDILIDVLKELKVSKTILIITHDIAFAKIIADTCYQVRDYTLKETQI